MLITGLQQRLLSSIEAFAKTLKVHRRTVQRQWEESKPERLTQSALIAASVGADDDRAALSEEQLAAEEEAQIEALSAATVGSARDNDATKLFALEQKLLDEMTGIAETHRDRPDARIKKLIDWIRLNQCPGLPSKPGQPANGAKWNNTRVIIFTEWDAHFRSGSSLKMLTISNTPQAHDHDFLFIARR